MNMSDISNVLLDTIDYAITNKLKNAPYDATILCTITKIINDTVTVSYGNENYIVAVHNPQHFSVGDQVHLKFPSNNRIAKYIEEDVSDTASPDSTVSSVNGKTGHVVLEITDIENLPEKLDALDVGLQIQMSASMPSNQSTNGIWYELESHIGGNVKLPNE